MRKHFQRVVLFLCCIAALPSCRKEFTSEKFLSTANDSVVSLETRNAFLYKEVLIGTYDSTQFDSTNGTFYFNLDSLPVDSQYYYRLTSVRNK